MAGVKGKSGGPRENAGGARPGAGRKPKAKATQVDKKSANASAQAALLPNDDPLDFLLDVMNNAAADPRLRVRAAIAAVQYKHTKRGDGGKKDDQADKAKKAGTGRFGTGAPPKLVVSNKK